MLAENLNRDMSKAFAIDFSGNQISKGGIALEKAATVSKTPAIGLGL
jgi:hypothetical protein